MVLKLLTLWVSISFCLFAGTTYYIDAMNGNDDYDGSEGTPWKNISKLNSVELQYGDIVYLKKGSLWRQQLNINSSGTNSDKIRITTYGTGSKPVISGSNRITNLQNHSGNVYSANWNSLPQQVFADDIRGRQIESLSALNKNLEWYFNADEKKIYIYFTGDPSSMEVEATVRPSAINIKGSNIYIEDIQLEKVYRNAILISDNSENVIINNVQFFQWNDGYHNENSAVETSGKNTEIMNCIFGKSTGKDIEDQNWAGTEGIVVKKGTALIHNNFIYHSAVENELNLGVYSHGIYVEEFSGTVKIFNNYIYHTGSHGIRVSGYFSKGDSIFIFNNTVEYAGQAGIAAFKTRGEDGIGGVGFIYNNHSSFSNRLGGDVGGNGSQSCGIHLNDGVIENTEPEKPFMKWYVYDNIVHDSQAPADPGSEDSGGIIADFNANNAEIYRNLIYNNWGKGISLWNSNNCKVYYNIVYGNDMGIVLSASNNSKESSSNHWIYNNTFYKNFNGSDKGSNLNTEIYFGKNGSNSKIENNIFYSSDSGYAYTFSTINSKGIILDHNIIYKEHGIPCYDSRNRAQSFEQWRQRYSSWDLNSINEFPDIIVSKEILDINHKSPGIDKAYDIGQDLDFKGNRIVGNPDIGAVEYTGPSAVEQGSGIPSLFTLFNCFPNPFNPETTIRFALSKRNFVNLAVYDILGNKVVTLINHEMEAGEHNIKFNSSLYNGISSGVYLYSITVGNITSSRKFVLLK